MADPKSMPGPGRSRPSVPRAEPAGQDGIGTDMQKTAPPPHPAASADEAAFDRWLRHHLTDLHADVLLEPPPVRFLASLGLRPREG
jgi:hypothetical protein